jgi:hypothetical protein
LVWLRVFLALLSLSSASLWRKRDMAVLNAAGGTSTAAPSSALIWAALSSSGSIFVWVFPWGSEFAISFLLLVLAISDGMLIGSQVADVKPKRHHLVMLGGHLLSLPQARSSNNYYWIVSRQLRRHEYDASSDDFNGTY